MISVIYLMPDIPGFKKEITLFKLDVPRSLAGRDTTGFRRRS